jgi:hypothetical protein
MGKGMKVGRFIKSIYDAYHSGLTDALRPTRVGRCYIFGTLRAAYEHIIGDKPASQPAEIKYAEQPAEIKYEELCRGWVEDYGCLGGAFLSLCRGTALAKLCEKHPLVTDVLIQAAKLMDLKESLQEMIKSGISLFVVVCLNLPPLAIKLLREPKGSLSYPNLLQLGTGYAPTGNEYAFWDICTLASAGVLKAVIEAVTVNELIERINVSCIATDGDYGPAMNANMDMIRNKLVTTLKSDPVHIKTTSCLRLQIRQRHSTFYEAILEIEQSHIKYRAEVQTLFSVFLPEIGLLSCLSPLLQSFLF